jgi:hypothetical protein
VPSPAEPAPALVLFLGDDNRPLRRARRGEAAQFIVGRGDGVEQVEAGDEAVAGKQGVEP